MSKSDQFINGVIPKHFYKKLPPIAIPYTLIFDNSRGVTLQTDNGYTHFYESVESAARDVFLIMEGQDPIKMRWEGNEPDHYISLVAVSGSEDRNLVVYNSDDVLDVLSNFDEHPEIINFIDFFTTLNCLNCLNWLPCLKCGKKWLFDSQSPEATGVFNVFCPDSDCEDRYALTL